MASIRKRIGINGMISYSVEIKTKKLTQCRSFKDEEDAKMYAWYKERLLNNMENYNIPLNERITLEQLYEMKIDNSPQLSKRTLDDMKNALKRLNEHFLNKFFCHEYTFDDWKSCFKSIMEIKIWRGGNVKNQREEDSKPISLDAVRKIFAYASSWYSFAQSKGIEIDNLPLKVIQTVILPKKSKDQ